MHINSVKSPIAYLQDDYVSNEPNQLFVHINIPSESAYNLTTQFQLLVWSDWESIPGYPHGERVTITQAAIGFGGFKTNMKFVLIWSGAFFHTP